MTPRSLQVTRDVDQEAAALRPRDVVSIRQAQEESDMARCPLCRTMLVARQGRAGPYFFCACVKRSNRSEPEA
jgi:hypothetical protein